MLKSTFRTDWPCLWGITVPERLLYLNAVAVALGGFLSGFDGVKSREILPDEVRLQYMNGEALLIHSPNFLCG